MKSSRCPIPVALLWVLLAPPVAAWDDVGHRVIARLAWEEMGTGARGWAVDLLAAAPPEAGLAGLMARDGRPAEARRREFFERAATWPDLIRGDRRFDHPPWHYINLFWERGPDGEARSRPDLRPAEENLVERLEALAVAAADSRRPASERALELAWLLHLVGDVHQPLHASSRVTPREPEGDRGGNLFDLHFDESSRGERRRLNLHAYWDGILRRAFPRRRNETAGDHVARLAASIAERRFPPPTPGAGFAAWAWESHELARRQVYEGLERGAKPSRDYEAATLAAAEAAVARAGHRLAELLESLSSRAGR